MRKIIIQPSCWQKNRLSCISHGESSKWECRFWNCCISRWPIKHGSIDFANEHLIWGSQRMATYAV